MSDAPPRDPRADHEALVRMSVLGELTGGIAHQLSTPLQLVAANLHFLQRSWPTFRGNLAANDNAGPASNEHAGPASNQDLAFVIEEVPKALAQSLQSLEQMGLLLRTMKEWSAPSEGMTQQVEPESVFRNVLLLTQHRWRYLFDVEHAQSAPLPTLHWGPQDIAAALTQLVLLVAGVHATRAAGMDDEDADDDLPTVTARCTREGDHVTFELTWRGALPLDSASVYGQASLSSRLHAVLALESREAGWVSARLVVPCFALADGSSVHPGDELVDQGFQRSR